MFLAHEDPSLMERLPAGLAAKTFNETAAKNLQPDIYYPIVNEENRTCKKHTRETHNIAHGISTKRSESVQKTFEAFRKSPVMLTLDEVNEQIYASSKTEPLGKSRVYGYRLPPEDFFFGIKPATQSHTIAETLNPCDIIAAESDEVRAMYRKTHKDFDPGEQKRRGYKLPALISESSDFKYGLPTRCNSGSVTECLRWIRD